MSERERYDDLLDAVGVCIGARIPFLLWGDPGAGKTSLVESASGSGWHVETLIVSHHEPTDFAGLLVLRADGTVAFAPPQWAQRLAEQTGPALAFFDEWTTAAPAVQAAALRTLTHAEVGSLRLPPTVAFGAAANPAEVAAAGWELAAPTANRFAHLDWALPLEVYAEATVTGRWPGITVPTPGDGYAPELIRMRILVAGFLRARPNLLSCLPKDAGDRGRAFPTPRTWDYAARLAALARSAGLGRGVVEQLIAGTVGPAAGHEFLSWADAHDLADPEELLADPAAARFTGQRPDRVYLALQAVLAAVTTQPSPTRWTAAIEVCARAADQVGVDPAVPVVRALLKPGIRPDGAVVPSQIRVFAAPLALAGLMPTPAA